jgi:nudix-type nucleoside diphosphatase (YffH/AdpP family)
MPPTISETKTLYQGWLKILGLRIRLDNGEEVRREVEDHGAAIAVLPYDPERRRALLIKLLRAPVLLTTGEVDLIEAPAGMIDENEDPVETARREAREETGLHLTTLEHVGTVWSSPGLSTERLHLYLAAYSQGDRVEAGGGVSGEQENITVLEMPLQELWSMVQGGNITDMKTLTLVLQLHARHPQLFAPE